MPIESLRWLHNTHGKSLKSQLIPLSGNNSHDYWEINARIILVEAIKKLRDTLKTENQQQKKKDKYPSMHELLEIMIYYDKKDFVEYFQGTEAQNVVNDQSTSTDAISVLRKIINSKIKVLRYLNDERKNAFSIRHWLNDETQQGRRLFVVMTNNDRESLKALFELWFNMAVTGKMSWGIKGSDQKVWYIADELAAEGIKFDKLKTGLSELRKYGGCIMAGFQSIDDLKETYGHNSAKSILQQFNTKLFFKVDEPESAKWVSQQIGSQDIKELHQSHSIGEHEMRSSETYQLQEKNKLLVTPDEIMSLPELKGYLKISGISAKVLIDIKYKDRPLHTEDLIKKEIIPFKPKSSKGGVANENTTEPTEATVSEEKVQKTMDKTPQKMQVAIGKEI